MDAYRIVAILGGARDYHAVDWYLAVKKANVCQVVFVTDMFSCEGMDAVLPGNEKVERLFIVDRFLFKNGGRWANVWRNLFKLIVLPVQVVAIKGVARRYPGILFHAHPMYYMLVCALAGVRFGGTPQGSELLIRAKKSRIYRLMAKFAMQKALFISVDSISMAEHVCQVQTMVKPVVVQNGVDIHAIQKVGKLRRSIILSVRGMTELYRTKEILINRDRCFHDVPISFVYPFFDSQYLSEVKSLSSVKDVFYGRVDKLKLYQLLAESILVISIPYSDSSPRSVYEAIFAGAAVGITSNAFVDGLTECMRKRLILLDLDREDWLKHAFDLALNIVSTPYFPSQEAIDRFDADISILKFSKSYYSNV